MKPLTVLRILAGLAIGMVAPYMKVAQAQGFFALENPADISDTGTVFARGHVVVASNFASIQDIGADASARYAPVAASNVALVLARATTGFTFNGYQVAGFHRQDWLGQTSQETLEVYRAAQAAKGLPVGATNPLQYKLSGFEAQGLSLGKSMQWSSLEWTLRAGAQASLLQGTKVKLQTATGQAVALNSSAISVDGSTTNSDSALDTLASGFVPQYRNGNPSGSGYSVDLGLTLAHRSGVVLQWLTADAASNMAWKDIPVVTLSGASTYNGQFPQGRKYLANFDQSLSVKNMVAVTVPLQNMQFVMTNTHIEGLDFPTLGVSRATENGKVISADYDTFFKTIGLKFATQGVSLSFKADALDMSMSKAVAFDLSFKRYF